MKKIICLVLSVLVIASAFVCFTGSSVTEKIIPSLNISADNISHSVSDNIYGLTLENKSNALDGGLVANLVNNNSFEYSNNPIASWDISAKTYSVDNVEGLNENNSNYLAVTVDGNGAIKNLGYTEFYNYKTYQINSKKANTPDMPLKQNEIYQFTAYFKNIDYTGTITASLEAAGNTEKYQFNIEHCTEWMPITLEIRSNSTADGALLLSFEGTGSFQIDQVTLVPMSSYGFGNSSWKYVSLRSDLMRALYNLSPSFVRFSAGELDSSSAIENIGSWKNTVGPLETRKQSYTHYNKYVYSVNSNSMGMYEYLLLCEDIGADAISVINAGIVTSEVSNYEKIKEDYENGKITDEDWQAYLDTISYCPGTEGFDMYLQDVLDLVEYANGDETTIWGAKRIEDGHKKSFNLKYIAIDNCGYGDLFWRNFDEIYKAIQGNFPDVRIIICTDNNKQSAEVIKKAKEDYRDVIVDESYCVKGGKLFKNSTVYDKTERNGIQTSISRYSVNTAVGDTVTKNNIWSAIENASFLTGVERNGDLVQMASYETTLAKVNSQTSDTSLVWFNSHQLVLTPDYYMQMIFANNMGTHSVEINDEEIEGVYRSVTVDTDEKVIYVKLVNSTKTPHKINLNIDGFKNVNNPTSQVMTANFKASCNEIGEDLHVAPVQTELTVKENQIICDITGYSVNVIRIPYGINDGTKLFSLPETELIVPYIPSSVYAGISCVIVAFVLITGAIILLTRVKHHKKIKPNK